MQAAQFLTLPLPITRPTRGLGPSLSTSSPKLRAHGFNLVKTSAVVNDSLMVDYSSPVSVFPAEACEMIGGEACDVAMFPEVKLESQNKRSSTSKSKSSSMDSVDREYYDYNSQKTVFPGEACDDLGGEFCEAEYQSGDY
ncbi:hypothetical protein MLD38_025440 [Melastoma candidum]|uniref:Uncharacterized protein n=1 Tax=Melastoma candidum TaxID=119954 RepID=A0ACB9P2A9_9MYRT|nr:hypothetical protein MLD38_025440 [Melastoma candidum]